MNFGGGNYERLTLPDNQPALGNAQWTRVIPLTGLGQLQIQGIKRLITLRKLPENWDSYGSPPPTEPAVAVAIELLMALDFDELPSPRIIPVSGGGVQLEWDVESRGLELEALRDGSIRYLKVEGGEPIEENEIAPFLHG
ncbi:MAG: hypothetical protein HW407_2339 [Bacteroidetes bacterium]|nr:hypothetical protein [Bacteroidota bacterium]